MNTKKLNPYKFLTIAIFIIILLLSIEPIRNYDIWWHLKTGEIIFNTGKIPDKDIFSYTKAGERWIDHEWLSQVIFFISYKLFGFWGPIILKTSVLIGSFFIIYKRNQLFLNGYCNVFSIALIAMISHISWVNRPLIFTFLFVPLLLFLLDLYTIKDKKILWSIPLIIIIWTNMHGSFILGLLLLFLYAVKALLQDRQRGIYLTKIMIISLVATLINPNTYHILLYPLQYAAYSVHSRYIVEWQSPSFTTFSAFEGALLFSLVVLAFSKKVDVLDLIFIILFTHLGLFALRNTALYAIVAVPIIFKYTQALVEEKFSSLRLSKDARRKIGLFSLSFSLAFLFIGVGLFGYSFYFNSYKTLKEHPVDYINLPKNATDYLLLNKDYLSKYNLFNTYHWGGYLIWRLYPSYKVFIDGRADLYGRFIEEYVKIRDVRPEYEDIMEKYNLSLILVPINSTLDVHIRENPNWTQIYSDNLAIIYLKTDYEEDEDEKDR